MDQHAQAFLSAALGVGDERLERRLLVGFHLIRDCCRIVDDPSWVPRVRVAKVALDEAFANGAFAPGDIELAALGDLLLALESETPSRAAVCSALLSYAVALYLEASFPAASAAFDVLGRLWTPECNPRHRLEAAYYQGMMLVRGRYGRDASKYVPILLALHARAAGEVEFIGLAGVVRLNRALFSGNLPLVLRAGERRLRQLQHHPSPRAEGALAHTMAVAHGRAGRPEDTLRIARRLLDDRYSPLTIFSALILAGTAFIELGELDAARAAYEVMLLGPTTALHRRAVLGLMDVHARRMERIAFERMHRYLLDQPLLIDERIYFWQISGRGWAKLGDGPRARAAFDEAYQIARECGLGYQMFETEVLIDNLPGQSRPVRAVDLVPEVVAHVSAMRAEHADDIAACLA